ncbi:substrate-binding domain-containing protein [Streptomyces sp. SID13031]|uniref:sugar ABC transporter substrate-binding protein n=1 Tax=Streptomyces sp. SID13031 TaxID=2706046 RepID=UPI0013C86643|nr:substrate-binding domain-containing protein [Streptomyces sp. SID13031]NEA36720.1 sugar ABC transporter substrate-binding protein [Streptomyces sp. SID13031]
MRIRTSAAVAVLAATSLLTACGSGSETTTGTGASGPTGTKAQTALAAYLQPPTTLPVSTPLSQTPPKGKQVYFLSDGIGLSQSIYSGFEAAAKELGWTAHVQTWEASNPATLNSAMLSAVNAGADAVAFVAMDAAALTEGLKAAQDKKVIVVGAATGNKPGTAGISAEVNSALVAGVTRGKMIGLGISAAAEKSGKAAHVVNVTAPVYASILKPTDDGVASTIKEYCAGCTFDNLNIAAHDLFSGKVPQLVVSYLQAHPDTNTISIRAAGLMQNGLVAALKSAGLTGLTIYGDSPLDAQIGELQKGEATGYTGNPLVVQGWQIVDAMAREVVDGNGDVYSSADAPEWWLTTDTKLDSGQPEFPAGYEAQFKKLWKLP